MAASGECAVTRSARAQGHGHWLLYVAIAVVGGLLTFVGARAQQKASEDATFRKLTDDYCAAWSSGNADAPAKFYEKTDGLVFYDLAPFAYHSWKEYRAGVQKEFLDGTASLKLTAGKDLRVSRRGTIAWTTVPMHLAFTEKTGKTSEMDLRYTGIWEKRGTSWLLVHEHLSVPLPEN
jgi:ketosteroid isomerase-like protein